MSLKTVFSLSIGVNVVSQKWHGCYKVILATLTFEILRDLLGLYFSLFNCLPNTKVTYLHFSAFLTLVLIKFTLLGRDWLICYRLV